MKPGSKLLALDCPSIGGLFLVVFQSSILTKQVFVLVVQSGVGKKEQRPIQWIIIQLMEGSGPMQRGSIGRKNKTKQNKNEFIFLITKEKTGLSPAIPRFVRPNKEKIGKFSAAFLEDYLPTRF